MSDKKFTNGEAKYEALQVRVNGVLIANINSTNKNHQANGVLICEAFNVANQSGLTPSQLLSKLKKAEELIKEARKEIIELSSSLYHGAGLTIKEAEATVKKDTIPVKLTAFLNDGTK